ncbi:unnamed protein product [Ectocarpus sp. 12 AP-2014]
MLLAYSRVSSSPSASSWRFEVGQLPLLPHQDQPYPGGEGGRWDPLHSLRSFRSHLPHLIGHQHKLPFLGIDSPFRWPWQQPWRSSPCHFPLLRPIHQELASSQRALRCWSSRLLSGACLSCHRLRRPGRTTAGRHST